jgi:hypothetical protein
MAKDKRTGEPDIDFMVIAELADGREARAKIEALDAGSALSYALDAGKLPSDAVSFRVVPISHWRRLQRAERKARKTGKVVKLPSKRARQRSQKGSCGLKRLPREVERAYQAAFGGGDS